MALYCRHAMCIGGETLCNVGSLLWWCGGYNFLVPAHGGLSAPRTRVHVEDLVVKRIRRGKSVAGPTPIERLHLGKALWLGVKVIAALSECATVPPTWRNIALVKHLHIRPYTADMRCASAGKHSATSGRCCSGAGGAISLSPHMGDFLRRTRESMMRISL